MNADEFTRPKPAEPDGPVVAATPETKAAAGPVEEPVMIEKVDVQAKPEDEDFDSTGMGSSEQQ